MSQVWFLKKKKQMADFPGYYMSLDYLQISFSIVFSLHQNLKLMSAIFHQMILLQELLKCFLFHPKSSFCSQDIQIFVFPTSPFFTLLVIALKGWLKINLKVYDVIDFQNKNLITHFVWYLEKERFYDIETLSIDRLLNEKHFYWKIMRKMCTKI